MTNTKKCSKCQETKSTTEFNKNKAKIDGLQYSCKSCEAAYNKAYQKTKSGKEANRRASSKHIGAMTVAQKAACKCTDNTRRRSDLSSVDLYGGLTYKEVVAMTELFIKERLRLEAETGEVHHVDHIIPIAAGGTHTKDNLQVLTAAANGSKIASDKLLAADYNAS